MTGHSKSEAMYHQLNASHKGHSLELSRRESHIVQNAELSNNVMFFGHSMLFKLNLTSDVMCLCRFV